jgi:hypothetical protein
VLEGMMLKRFTTSQKQYLAHISKPFVLQKGILYRFEKTIGFIESCNQNKYP